MDFRNHLLELTYFCKEIKSCIRNTLIQKLINTHPRQIPLSKSDFRNIQTTMLYATLIKASRRLPTDFPNKIDPLDIIYSCFSSIKYIQETKEKKDKIEENTIKRKLTKELEILNKISKPNRAKKRELVTIRNKLQTLTKESRRKKAADLSTEWALLGETGLTYFFRSAQAKRQKLWVRQLEIYVFF